MFSQGLLTVVCVCGFVTWLELKGRVMVSEPHKQQSHISMATSNLLQRLQKQLAGMLQSGPTELEQQHGTCSNDLAGRLSQLHSSNSNNHMAHWKQLVAICQQKDGAKLLSIATAPSAQQYPKQEKDPILRSTHTRLSTSLVRVLSERVAAHASSYEPSV
jgi:hypothetical protein